jgi:hypothetical protein
LRLALDGTVLSDSSIFPYYEAEYGYDLKYKDDGSLEDVSYHQNLTCKKP